MHLHAMRWSGIFRHIPTHQLVVTSIIKLEVLLPMSI